MKYKLYCFGIFGIFLAGKIAIQLDLRSFCGFGFQSKTLAQRDFKEMGGIIDERPKSCTPPPKEGVEKTLCFNPSIKGALCFVSPHRSLTDTLLMGEREILN